MSVGSRYLSEALKLCRQAGFDVTVRNGKRHTILSVDGVILYTLSRGGDNVRQRDLHGLVAALRNFNKRV